MKKIKYLTFAIVLFLIFGINIYALDCYYVKQYDDANGDGVKEKLEAYFRINENNNTIVFSNVYGYFGDTTDHKNVKSESQSIENWGKKFQPIDSKVSVDFDGKSYYTEEKKCPPRAILIDRNGQFDFAVSPDDTSFDAYYSSLGTAGQGKAVMKLTPTNSNLIVRYPTTCNGLNKPSCNLNENIACVWVENDAAPGGGYCNVDNLLYVGCGDASDIPMQVPGIISMLVNLLKIATPIILIFIGMITLFKAMTAGKEDEIKKATNSLVKKIISAALVFFVVAIVQFIIGKVAEDDEYEGFESCLNCFLNNRCETATYYKAVVAGDDYCTPLTTGSTDTCENMFK